MVINRKERSTCPTASIESLRSSASAPEREAAAQTAVETAAKTVRDLRVAEVSRQDLTIENGKVTSYRVRLSISFKYDTGD